MKAVILAGGLGTRLSEETAIRPKPMVEIGGKPILWHIMKVYSAHGINEFIICCGYKGYIIKEFFSNYFLHTSDVTFDVQNNQVEFHHSNAEPWKVTVVDTGDNTMTGGRIKRVKEYIDHETFCLTYGDGVTDLNIGQLLAFHKAQRTLATLTAVQPPGRFGAFSLPEKETRILSFREKVKGDGAWINGGYFVLEPQVFDYIRDDSTIWEQEPMRDLAEEGQLSAFKHHGYWQNMDTLRDKYVLEEIWQAGKAPWKTWR
ncbi:MAG: glucose-1-phosphate cytidylyltransferase [Nitrospira sp.]|nr:MAG: glucose-1-phosphate cytidylyltransferase [Nitrospira sp.]